MTDSITLNSVVGFDGRVDNSLILHNDQRTLIYPIGSNIVIRPIDDIKQQEFLQGHTDRVSCLALSPSGKYLASGQITNMGFVAHIILWEFESRRRITTMKLQKVKIQDLCFSWDEQYLASLGGNDDNSLVLWDVQTGEAICGSPTHANFTLKVKFLNHDNHMLVTAGNYNLNFWEYDKPNNKLRIHDIQLGQLQRLFNCITVDPQDEYVYCGTTTGDMLQVGVSSKLLRNSGPAKGNMLKGVCAITYCPNDLLAIGGGDGTIKMVSIPPENKNLKFLRKMPSICEDKVEGQISTIQIIQSSINKGGFKMLVGTYHCNMYIVTYDMVLNTMKQELVQTTHVGAINDLAFPPDFSAVFATCGLGEIRVWHLDSCRELLKIVVPNLECHCVAYTHDGQSLVSGWSDGKIRAFGPRTGKILYTIHNAHHKAVTAIASTNDSNRLISGGDEGLVRIWKLAADCQTMVASKKEHKGPVNCIVIKESTSDECVTASSDGSCVIWDLNTYKRRNSLFGNTFFKSVAYHPDESQLVTTGTDRKIGYWDAYDGQQIRTIDASEESMVNSLAVDVDGEVLVSGGGDKVLKLWGYDEGHCYQTGIGHSGPINKVAITPDKQKIVTVGQEDGIFIWNFVRPDIQSC
eukprot:TRINITY_DN13287_c0_g1_i1.p1 TRINITY_DN13287_c0_g1~~TRINITY_DN13287_c0_g1_i1.p1  ORF type:complete len:634 (+),score=78.24 TRINITY_DN13287_c0_g1_i1:174-2075(+)